MIKKIIPLLIICITAGFLASCSSSDPLIGDAESNIKNGNYDAALTSAEESIQQNPQNPLGYYYKGVALGQKGQDLGNAEQATDLYKQMNDAFEQARQKASASENTPDEINRIVDVRNSLWQSEHNEAVALATNDSLMEANENTLDDAVAHLNNATIIQPDSSLSWQVLAQVNGQRQHYGEAAKAQEKYLKVEPNPDAKAYLLLAQYYRFNDEPEKALEVIENVRSQYPDNVQVIEVLADSYSENGQPEKAIATVQQLVEKDPSNPKYHMALGTQIYTSALNIQDTYDENLDKIFDLQQSLRSASGSEKQKIQNQIDGLMEKNKDLQQQLNSLADRAITELNAAIESDSENAKAYNTLGVIYQNKAAVFFDQRTLAVDNQEVDKFDKQGKDQLRKAMTNYEKAAELDPGNPQYWRRLFQIYTVLGMDKKAAEAEKKAGMQ